MDFAWSLKNRQRMWTYKNTTEFDVPNGAIGYIYRIINKLDNRIYIGRKMLTSTRKKVLSKKEKLLPENSRKKFKRETKETNWQNYWGSCAELTEDIKKLGQENFTREILAFLNTKTDVSYYETWYQIKYDVLFEPSYNRHIANTKFFKGKVTRL